MLVFLQSLAVKSFIFTTISYTIDQKVTWKWGSGTASGTVKKVYTSKITKIIKESEVTRDATQDDPAYLILQADGDEVLKSHSELSAS